MVKRASKLSKGCGATLPAKIDYERVAGWKYLVLRDNQGDKRGDVYQGCDVYFLYDSENFCGGYWINSDYYQVICPECVRREGFIW